MRLLAPLLVLALGAGCSTSQSAWDRPDFRPHLWTDQQCLLSFSRRTALATRDHPAIVCVEALPGPEFGARPRTVPQQFRFRRTIGLRARETVIASSDCPAARERLASLSGLPSPTPFTTDVDGPEIILVVADGSLYRLETRAHYGLEPGLRGINDVSLIVEAQSRTPLALWVDEILAALNDCSTAIP
jgi:hypothetical protein